MESLKIKTNNFWVNYYRFIFCMRGTSELPEDTCTFRRDLILGTLLALPILPLLLILFLIYKFSKDGQYSDGRFIFLILLNFFIFLAFLIVGSIWEREFIPLLFLKLNGVVLIFLIIAIAIASGIIYTVSLIEDWRMRRRREKFYSEEEPKERFVFFKEMYRSAKEKYCKRIEYVN